MRENRTSGTVWGRRVTGVPTMTAENKMIQDHEILQMLIETYPKSRQRFVEEIEYWIPKQGPITPHSLLSIFSGLVKDRFLEGDYDQAEELFSLIERFVCEGSENVSNAACTCFIENLQNYCGTDDFDGSHFVSLLGPESFAYAKAWDAFTGVETEGIRKIVRQTIRRGRIQSPDGTILEIVILKTNFKPNSYDIKDPTNISHDRFGTFYEIQFSEIGSSTFYPVGGRFESMEEAVEVIEERYTVISWDKMKTNESQA